MKIIHTADLHLNSKLQTHFSQEKAEKLNYKLLFAFENLCAKATELGVKIVLICGDLFDSEKVSPHVLERFNKIISSNQNLEFLFIYGNHDYNPQDNIFKNFPKNFVIMSGNMTINRENVTFSTIQSASTPLPKDAFNVVLGHGSITKDFSCDLIDLKSLENKNIDYLALGHIHTNRLEKLDARGVWAYSGILSGRGFDECGQKGFMLIDTENLSYTFMPTDNLNFYSIELNKENMGMQEFEQLAKSTLNFDKNSAVRLKIYGKISNESEFNLEYLRQYFADKFFHFELENHLTVDYDRLLDSEKPTLKSEFIRVVQNEFSDNANEIIEKGLKYLL